MNARAPARHPRRRSRGVVLIALLLAIVFAAVLALAGAESWSTTVQRERETELLFAGHQYRKAIRSYYYATPPGQARVLPASLDELLEDHRFPVPVRHLRRLYPDPVNPGGEWGLATNGGRIAGVYSQSEAEPMKQTGFEPADSAFEARTSYKEWTFLFVPPVNRRR